MTMERCNLKKYEQRISLLYPEKLPKPKRKVVFQPPFFRFRVNFSRCPLYTQYYITWQNFPSRNDDVMYIPDWQDPEGIRLINQAFMTQMLNVWYIYQHLGSLGGKCRWIHHTLSVSLRVLGCHCFLCFWTWGLVGLTDWRLEMGWWGDGAG